VKLDSPSGAGLARGVSLEVLQVHGGKAESGRQRNVHRHAVGDALGGVTQDRARIFAVIFQRDDARHHLRMRAPRAAQRNVVAHPRPHQRDVSDGRARQLQRADEESPLRGRLGIDRHGSEVAALEQRP